jgi:hypothetical protein
MSYFPFRDEDLIETYLVTNPSYVVELNGDKLTGSIFLEKKFLNNDLQTRIWQGYSELSGGYITKQGPFSSSIAIVDAELEATNKQLYKTIIGLYDYYDIHDADYTPNYTGSVSTRFRVITIPEIYYDNSILTGSLTASDIDADGSTRILYDNGRGGVYSGSMSGTIVGNIFYNEGMIVLKGGGLSTESPNSDFGEVSNSNFKWRLNFKGVHKIPVKVFRCHAPAGQLNASTNSTFFKVLTGSLDDYRNQKQLVLSESITYITTIGLYNEDYELIGMAKLAQPIKKEISKNLLFRVRLDF